jgi:hypothetical protein
MVYKSSTPRRVADLSGMGKSKKRKKAMAEVETLDTDFLIEVLQEHRGMFARIADKVGCDPSYVSRVVAGKRSSDAVQKALREEIRAIHRKFMLRRTLTSR